jgi:hypothetical protein
LGLSLPYRMAVQGGCLGSKVPKVPEVPEVQEGSGVRGFGVPGFPSSRISSSSRVRDGIESDISARRAGHSNLSWLVRYLVEHRQAGERDDVDQALPFVKLLAVAVDHYRIRIGRCEPAELAID